MKTTKQGVASSHPELQEGAESLGKFAEHVWSGEGEIAEEAGITISHTYNPLCRDIEYRTLLMLRGFCQGVRVEILAVQA